ncbi:hypothetical protein AX334_07240 [Salmonella enterica]|nr:hypothetical protein [Salmonella enterica]EBB7877702.1 hypothetical protein [Salmonella enterica]
MSDVTLLAEVTTFLRQRHGQFIAGERQAGNGTNFSVTNPATGKIIADVVSATLRRQKRPCRAPDGRLMSGVKCQRYNAAHYC